MKRTIQKPVSPHSHLRQGLFRVGLVRRIAEYFSIVLAILNTEDGIMDGDGAMSYCEEALKELRPDQTLVLKPAMMANEKTTAHAIFHAYDRGVRHVKFLPKFKTTNAHYGVENFAGIDHVLGAMQSMSLEHPDDPMFAEFHPAHPSDRHDNDEEEYMFLPIFEQLHMRFLRLKMIWKHLSDARVIKPLMDMGEMVAIGVTGHHPFINSTIVYGQNANGVFKPTAGDEEDREAIVRLITSDFSRVFSDPDDAPHPKSAKTDPCKKCCGADTTETLILLHLTTFERAGKLKTEADWERFENFLTYNACRFYGWDPPHATITVERGEHKVPLETDVNGIKVVPFWAGQTLPWRYVQAA